MPVWKAFDGVVLANLYLLYRGAFTKDLDLGVGVYDLFDSEYEYIQPYDGGHAPLPAPSRELAVKLSYRF